MLARFATLRLLTVTAFVQLVLGLAIHAFPLSFTEEAFLPLRPYFPLFCFLLLLGGTLTVDAGRLAARGRTRLLGAVAGALPLLIFAGVMAQAGLWTGLIHYGTLAAALLAEPWLTAGEGHPESRRPPLDLATKTCAVMLVAIAAVLLLFPDDFQGRYFLPFFHQTSLMAGLALLSGVALFFGSHTRAGMLLGTIFPALLAYNYVQTGLMTGALAWTVWTVALLLNWRPVPVRPIAEGGLEEVQQSLPHFAAFLERWPPVIVASLAGLVALGGEGAALMPGVVSFGALLATTYSLVMRHVIPDWGTPRERTLLHLAFVTIMIGSLFAGIGGLGNSLIILLVMVPLVAARRLGYKSATGLYLLALVVIVAAEATQVILQHVTWGIAVGSAILEIGAVAVSASIGMGTANQQQRLINRLEESGADLQLHLKQLLLQQEIVRAIRSSLDLDQTLTAAAEQLRLAFDVPGCLIRLNGPHPREFRSQRWQDAAFSAAISTPIVVDGEGIGSISLLELGRPRVWAEEQQAFLASVADHLGVAIVHARMHEQLVHSLADLQAANEELVAQGEELQAANEELTAQQEELAAQNDELIAGRAELEASEARFAGVLAIAGDAIISIDHARRILLFNRAAEKMFGYLEREMIGQPLSLLLPESTASADGVITDLEVTGCRRGGDAFAAEASVSTLRLGAESISTVILRDITERRRSEQAVRDATELQRKIFGASSAGILVYNEQGQCVAVNEAACAVVGAPTEKLLAQNFRQIPSWQASGLLAAAEQTMQTGDEIATEVQLTSSFGRSVWMDARLTRFRLGGRPHLLLMVSDVTERKLAEQELELFFDASLEMLCIVGPDGYFKKVSPTWSQTLGWTDAELLSRPCVEFVHPDDRAATQEIDREHKAGNRVSRFENRYLCKDGSYRWIDWSAAWVPMRSISVAAARDITERKQFEEALKRAKDDAEQTARVKGEFLANISHEIRTPLNAVIGFSELLHTSATDDRQKGYLESIQTAGRSLLSLISDILDISKADAGLVELHPSAVDLRCLVSEMELIFRQQLQSKGLRWQAEIDPATPDRLMLDEQRLRQVLLNLVGNAVKFTEEGFVGIAVRWGEGSLTVTVADSGVGIPPADQERVFEPFRQRSGQSDRKHGGTGLGLTISRRLVELMGGSLTLQSEVGVGSRFLITLPHVTADGAPDSPAGPAITSGERELQSSLPPVDAAVIPAREAALLTEVEGALLHRLGGAVRMSDVQRLSARLAGLDQAHGLPVLAHYGRELERLAGALDVAAIGSIVRRIAAAHEQNSGGDER